MEHYLQFYPKEKISKNKKQSWIIINYRNQLCAIAATSS